MHFQETTGNDYRYQWSIRVQAAPLQPPVGVDYVEDGIYPYKIRVSTDGGSSWSWLGTSGFPDGGDDLALDWENWVVVPWITFFEPDSFTEVPVGESARRVFELINTTNETLAVTDVRLEADGFELDDVELPVELDSGERVSVNVSFSPTAPGPASATLEVDLYEVERPALTRGTRSFVIEATGR